MTNIPEAAIEAAARVIRDQIVIGQIGPNSAAILARGGTVSMTPSEAEDAARAVIAAALPHLRPEPSADVREALIEVAAIARPRDDAPFDTRALVEGVVDAILASEHVVSAAQVEDRVRKVMHQVTEERDEARAEVEALKNSLAPVIEYVQIERGYTTLFGDHHANDVRLVMRDLRWNAEARQESAELRAALAERDAVVERVRAIHQPIRVYDECEHDADHGCEPIEVYDYMACSESQIGWGCAVCCYDDDYPLELCPHGGDHRGVGESDSCPTRAAVEGGGDRG